ncbi:metallophosphoesterase [Acidisoma cellulosilytica]|uniref:Metallophosphoesterase n=1 Tax=Acidisoma cellulosilyticum TaxID=2802395 RepID=A0A964E4S7_9PROT|nr:metallophosphoesterase [Acidisoma cellulosilyticum]MCB8881687.1 metallophosphoesterase [Acidisoma cellulosilyticum]
MAKTWFVADTHFGHRGIIEMCFRPFASIEEHDAALISNWNSRVGGSDTVYHLGDFSHRSGRDCSHYLDRLKGKVHLIHGNHDREATRADERWLSSTPMMHINHQGHHITLCHYAMRVWPKSHRGSLHLYGHSHGRLSGDRQSLDVGVDCWGYYPISLDEILERLQTQPD